MSLIERVDLWLLERPYQWLVDASQRKPAWWVEQCAYAFLVFGAADVMMVSKGAAWWRYLMVFLIFIGALSIWLEAKIPSMMARSATAMRWRRFLLVLVSINTPLIVLREALWLPGFAFGLALISSYYFAACKPPRPPERKTKLAPGAA